MKLESVLSRVVFPEPVPPEITMFSRAFIAPSMSASISGVNALNRNKSSLESGREPNIRIVTTGPSSARGGMMALNREPLGSRASTIGEVSSTRRPTRETMRSMICSRCSLSRKTTSDFWIRPSFSMKIFLGPLIMMSPILSSLSKSSSGPKPKVSSRISLTRRWRSLRFSSGFSVSQRCSTMVRISLRSVFGSISLTRFISSRSTSWM